MSFAIMFQCFRGGVLNKCPSQLITANWTRVIIHHIVALFSHLSLGYVTVLGKLRKCEGVKVREAFLFWRNAPIEDGDHDDLDTVFIHQVDQSIERHPENTCDHRGKRSNKAKNLLGKLFPESVRIMSMKKELGALHWMKSDGL